MSFDLRHRYQGTMQAGREALEAALATRPSIAQIKPSISQMRDQAYEALKPSIAQTEQSLQKLRARSRSLALHVRTKLERQLNTAEMPLSSTMFNVALVLLFAPGLLYFIFFDDTFAQQQQQLYTSLNTSEINPETYHVFLLCALAVFGALSFRQYYNANCIETPKISFSPSPRNAHIVKALENTLKPFMPAPWALNGHIQSFLFAYWPLNVLFGMGDSVVNIRREMLEMDDGGLIAVDWLENSNTKALPDDAPILVLLPGVVGKSDNPYIKRMALAAIAQGWRPVAKSYRGVGIPMQEARPETWSHRTILDMDAAVEHIRARYPDAVMCGAGFSFGGMQLLSYLGARQDNPLAAGVVLSGVFDAELIFPHGVQSHVVPPYDLALYMSLLADSQPNLPLLSAEMSLDLAEVFRRGRWSLHTYHDYVTRHHMHDGSKPESVAAYFKIMGEYHRRMLAAVERPVLCLMAEDDPLVPPQVAAPALRAATCAPGPIILQTQRGGHCGWFDGPAGRSWADETSMSFLKAAVQV